MADIIYQGKTYQSDVDPRTGKVTTATSFELPDTFTSPYLSKIIGTNVLDSNVPKLDLPTKVQSNYSGLESAISSSTNTFNKEMEALRKKNESSTSDIASLIESIATTEGSQNKLVEAEGGFEAKKKADEYTSQIEAEQLASRRAVENILKNNPTGALRGGQLDMVENIQRDSLSKQADLAILQNAELRRYDTAINIAKAKVEMELAPQKAKLEALKYIKDSNAMFDTAELNNIIKKEERAYQNEKTEKDNINNVMIEALKNGASSSIVDTISKSKNYLEAIKNAGGFLMSAKERKEIEKLDLEIKDILDARKLLGGSVGDPVVDIIVSSSKYGDKRLTDSQLEKIQQATNALGSMESLQVLLSQGKDGVKLTGPITGKARTLISQMGGDANAKAINATIQGLIPTVARGIFGEVGVLTDADIENYKKTIPNLTSTEDQNKLISIVMYDVLSRSLSNTLTTNAKNQTNVSNFADVYIDSKNRINQLKSELGVVDTIPESPELKAYLDNQTRGGLIDNINAGISNYANGFTRTTK